jgi:hypothetical protein
MDTLGYELAGSIDISYGTGESVGDGVLSILGELDVVPDLSFLEFDDEETGTSTGVRIEWVLTLTADSWFFASKLA